MCCCSRNEGSLVPSLCRTDDRGIRIVSERSDFSSCRGCPFTFKVRRCRFPIQWSIRHYVRHDCIEIPREEFGSAFANRERVLFPREAWVNRHIYDVETIFTDTHAQLLRHLHRRGARHDSIAACRKSIDQISVSRFVRHHTSLA
jgi:hypothetical protein